MSLCKNVARLCALPIIFSLGACASRPPSIAHVHIGHALTGVHVTPGKQGYMLVAEQRADAALGALREIDKTTDLMQIKQQVATVLTAVDSPDDFGLKQSLMMASNHITFAATSQDASANLQQSAPVFANSLTSVVQRCDYMTLLGKDVVNASSKKEADVLIAELIKLAVANVEGDDADGNGVKGSSPAEYGMKQLRAQLEAMLGRENPPYRTVDQWYLFNLVRLPNGRWVFDKLGRGGNIDGYK